MMIRQVGSECVWCDERDFSKSAIIPFMISMFVIMGILATGIIYESINSIAAGIVAILVVILCMWFILDSLRVRYDVWIVGEQRMVLKTGNPNAADDINKAADELEKILRSRREFQQELEQKRKVN